MKEISISCKSHPTFVDLFAGCGGLSLGLLSAGWKGVLAVEKSQDAFRTFSHNLLENNTERPPQQPIYSHWPDDIEKQAWDIDRFLETHTMHLQELQGKVGLLAGGPPCQGFSIAGRRNGDDPRNRLFVDYLAVVAILNPAVVLIENVKGMDIPFREPNGDSITFAQDLRAKLSPCYHVQQGIVMSQDFGVPQIRPRLITVGFNRHCFVKQIPEFFPRLNKHRRSFLQSKRLANRNQTVSDAISDIKACDDILHHRDCCDPDSPRGFSEIRYEKTVRLSRFQTLMRARLKKDQQPNSLRLVNHRPATLERFKLIHSLCNRGEIRCGVQLSAKEREVMVAHGADLSKKHVMVVLDGDRPAHTVTTIPDDLLHYCLPRVHTIREYARLQSFPDWFAFQGKFTTGGNLRKTDCPRYTQVGNAVPPLLAEAIGEVLLEIYQERGG